MEFNFAFKGLNAQKKSGHYGMPDFKAHPSKTMGMFCGNSSFAQAPYNVQNVCANQT